MVLIICITAVVALVSLYDYFSNRTWTQVTSSLRNDIVFENRNRSYGAYQIRRDYNRRVLLILFGFVAGIGGLYAASIGFRGTEEAYRPRPVVDPTLFDPKQQPEVEIPEPEIIKTPVQPSGAETYKFIDPIVKDIDIDTQSPVVPDDKNPGTITQKGNEFGDPGIDPGFGDEKPPVVSQVIQIKDDGPEINVDIPAEYIGGRPAMLKFMEKNFHYPEDAQREHIQGKVYTQFVVSKEGDIEDVKIQRGIAGCTECDKEAVRVVKKMPRWKPGVKAGRNVASYFNLPIYFKLADE